MTSPKSKTEYQAKAETYSVNTLVKVTDSGYAIVVGYTDDGHPLLLDLPGVPREHQTHLDKA